MRWRIGSVLAAALLAACSGAQAAPAARDVRVGVDACEYCHMAVDDARRAAQWVPEEGPPRMFDEPGCLLAWLGRHPGTRGAAFLADEKGGGWVRAAEAFLVRGGARTGMGFDLVAFRDEAAARARAAETGGRLARWEELFREGVMDVHAH